MFTIYKKIVIFLVVLLLFSYVFTYLGIAVNPYLSPLYFIYLSIALTTLLILSDQNSIIYILKAPIYRWMLFYFIVLLIWIMLPNAQSNYEGIRQVILSIIVMFTLTTLMFFDDDKLSITRKAILLATLIAIFNNIHQFFNPGIFSFQHIVGRSAGLYINANTAAEAIILGMIFSYAIVPNKLKTIFLLSTLLGIIFTFSRSGLASWFIVVLFLSWTKVVERNKLFIISAIILAGIILALPILIGFIETNLGSGANNILERIDFFSSKEREQDYSQQKRIEIASSALRYFSDNPIIGAGVGFLQNWEYGGIFDTGARPHNAYLALMVEYGIIGFFIIPLLLLSTIWKSTGEAKKISLAFFVYVFLIGFFTDNTLDNYYYLVAYSLMASMSFRSRTQ